MDETGIEFTPEADFEPIQAKFSASLLWLVLRATENDDLDYETIPPEVTSPFDNDSSNKIREPVIGFLCDGIVYAVVFNAIFKAENIITTFDDLILCLRKHVKPSCIANSYLLQPNILKDHKSFRLDAHLALIDTLLLCYSFKIVTVKDITFALRNLSPSKDFTSILDVENGISSWLSALCDYQNHLLGLLKPNGQPKHDKFFPVIDSLMDHLKDGKSLLAILLFYCNESLTIDCVKLSTPLQFTDCIHNIQLFRELCAEHICTSIFALKAEDIAYGPSCLKPIMMALLCEIFFNVEIVRRGDAIPVYQSLIEPKANNVPSTEPFKLDVKTIDMQQTGAIEPNSVVLEDFDHQRTHAMATSVERIPQDRPVSTQAWSNQKSASKPNRISLDFHPSSAQPVIGNIQHRQPNQHLTALQTLTQSLNPLNDVPIGLKKSSSSSSSVTITEPESSNKERQKWNDSDDVPSPQFEDDVYGISSSIPITNKQVDTSHVINAIEKQPLPSNHQADVTDEDALSTITEKSEPSSPSVYSYESTQTISDMSTSSPSAFSSKMTMSNDFGYPQSSIFSDPPEDDLSVRGSFVTPNRHTAASAAAAGLPIILARTKDRSNSQGNPIPMMTNISDTLSSQDMYSLEEANLSTDPKFNILKSQDFSDINQKSSNSTIYDDRDGSTPIQVDNFKQPRYPDAKQNQIASAAKLPSDIPVSPRPKWSYLEVDLPKEKHRSNSRKGHSDSSNDCDSSQDGDNSDLNQSANLTTWFELSLRSNDCANINDYEPSTDVHVLSPTGDSPTTWAEIMKKASAIDKNSSPEGLSHDIQS